MLPHPLGLIGGLLLLEGSDLLVQLIELGLIVLSTDGLTLDLKLCDPTSDLIKVLGQGVDLHPQTGSSLIHEVNSLVREEAIGDITIGETYGSDDRIILDTHLMMVLILLLQST